MQVYGIDLAEWWKARRWVALIELIDGLPSASRLNEARMSDPELAELELAHSQKESEEEQIEGTWSPPISEFGTQGAMFAAFIDEIRGLRSDLAAMLAGKQVKMEPFPRPVTELENARARRAEHEARDLFKAFGFSDEDL